MMSIFHSSEIKRRLKAEQKAKEKAEKQAKAAAENADAPNKKPAAEDEGDIDPNVCCKQTSLCTWKFLLKLISGKSSYF